MLVLKIVLFPFSIFYGCVLAIRNLLFDLGIKKSQSFDIPVLCVGNITVGGTGKTPFVEFLISILQECNKKIAVLSRGYRRKTKGWVLATEQSTADEIGDEPCQLKRKFSNTTVAVCESRVEGITQLLQLPNVPELIVLDDAFQHRAVRPSFSVLLMDYNRPLWTDTPFPGGRLREFAWGRKRAQVVVVTKCPPSLSIDEKDTICKRLAPIEVSKIFFSHISYANPKSLFETSKSLQNDSKIVVITGIAMPEPFIAYLQKTYSIAAHLQYADHHHFTDEDIVQISETAMQHSAIIVTTEKDAMRLQGYKNALSCISVWYLPISIEIDRRQDLIDEVFASLF